jgi:hypothetical protein
MIIHHHRSEFATLLSDPRSPMATREVAEHHRKPLNTWSEPPDITGMR